MGKKAQVGFTPPRETDILPPIPKPLRPPGRKTPKRKPGMAQPSRIDVSDISFIRPSTIGPSLIPKIKPSDILGPKRPGKKTPFEPSIIKPGPPERTVPPPIIPEPRPSDIKPPKIEAFIPSIITHKGFEGPSVPTRKEKRRKVLRPKPGLPGGLEDIRSLRKFRRTPSFAGVTLPQLGFKIPKFSKALEQTGLVTRGFERPVQFGSLLGKVRRKRRRKK
jgi:hypothetical protein